MEEERRIGWVDMARGICMMAILFFHAEKYDVGEEIIPYACYVNNAIIFFFFVSGYLFKKPQKAFSLRHKLRSILRTMVIPYFVFTLILALPKAFVHDDMSITEVLTLILTGHASWFIAALIVCELFFAFLLHVTEGKGKWLFICSALPYFLIASCYHFLSADALRSINVWCWQNACLLLFFMYAGYHYRKMEPQLHSIHPAFYGGMVILLIVLKYLQQTNGMLLTLEPITVSSFTLLLIDGCLGILVLLVIFRRMPQVRLVEWTGKNSLFYYFICGGVPFMVSKGLQLIGFPYQGIYVQVIVAFLLVYIFSTIIVYGLNHLYSFLFLKNKRKKE